MGVCPYASALADCISSSEGVDAAIMTTLCDQKRRISGIMARRSTVPLFLLNLPSTWAHEGARRLYSEELKRLGSFLEKMGAVPPTKEKLAAVMRSHETLRRTLLSTRPHLSGSRFSLSLAALRNTGTLKEEEHKAEEALQGIPVAVIGGPALTFYRILFTFIEEHGGAIVLDGTDDGERTLPAPFREENLGENPFEELVHAYFDTIPHPFRRPNDMFYSWLAREVTARQVRGIVLLRHTWCDIWHAEVRPFKEHVTVPILDLELDHEDYRGLSLSGRCTNRIMAFLEALA
jgi:benzoyl-CoA reductase/2-hydroxyglutaryl-CoA dehydratase subunit BcrC/BadD/HgdB